MRHFPTNSLRLAIAVTAVVLVSSWRPGSILNPIMQAQTAASVAAANASEPSSAKVDPSAAVRISSEYGKLPISFEVNQGQTDGSVQFLARGAGYTLFLTPGEAVLSLNAVHAKAAQPGSPIGPRDARASGGKVEPILPSSTVRLQLIGANTRAEVVGVDALPGKSNYFIGNDPAKWQTDVPTYAKVRYSDVYPGIDLVYYGNQEGRLEHDFIVAPGADPNAIGIGLRANEGPVADGNGGLTLHTQSGELTLNKPVVYQEVGGERNIIPAAYEVAANDEIRFRLGSYDKDAPLIIDPVLEYSAVFGGTGNDEVFAIAVDTAGNAYVTGNTSSSEFPLVHPFQTSGPAGWQSAFVSKVNASGTALLYSTYLGGGLNIVVSGTGIAVDSTGRAYVVGYNRGGSFPVKNAYQAAPGNGFDAFLTVFNPAGNSLVYSTLLGGDPGHNQDSLGWAISLDGSQNAYIGGTSGLGFPATHTLVSNGTSFVAKFNGAGVLQYSTVFGDSDFPSHISALSTDAAGAVYFGGFTYQETALAGKLNPGGASLSYSKLLPSAGRSWVYGIAVNSDGEAYVAGSTEAGFPTTKNAFQKTFGGPSGGRDGFVAKLNSAGTALVYSTYLGGTDYDDIAGMAIDQYRQVYVTGYTQSQDFPLKAPLQARTSAYAQFFVTTLSSTLNSIVYYSTYFGTGSNRVGGGPMIAVDKALNVYLTGFAGGIPITPGALTRPETSNNIFISKFVIMDDVTLGLSGTPSPVVHGSNLTYTIAVTSKGPDFGYNLRVADTLPAGTTFVSYGAGGGTCVAPAVGGTGTLNCTLPQLNKGGTWNVTLTVKVNAASGTNLSNTAAAISNMQDFVPSNNTGTLTTRVN